MGLRSPLLPLGIAAPSVIEQGGFVTLPWWRGGSVSTTEQAGYITLPWWRGGGDVGTSAATGQKGGVTRKTRKRRRDELYDEEEEELAIIYALLMTGHIRH